MTDYERGKADGIREEAARILGRIREGIASWDSEPDPNVRGLVQASLTVLSTCITHRGVGRDQAVKAALDRTAETQKAPAGQ